MKQLALFAVACCATICFGCSTSDPPAVYFDQCVDPSDRCDNTLTEEECYVCKRDPGSAQLAEAMDIARRYMEEHPPEEELWDWTSGVFMFALTELYRVTKEEEFRDYYKAYLDHHISEGYDIVWSDGCPPALTALALLREMEDPGYRQVIVDVLEYLEDAPRREHGGIDHLGILTPGIWLDSLFMFGMVLSRHGEADDNAQALDLMSEQLGIFADVLQHENGLMQHADQWLLEFDTDIYWARGNGWVTASLSEYLRVLVLRRESDAQANRMFQSQVESLLAAQDADSDMWWTVLNRPGEGDNYIETSAAALFAYGMARAWRYGLLDERALESAKRAVAAVQGAVDTDEQERPFVRGISNGTEPSTFDGYVAVPILDDLNYGVGAVILALIETSGLPASPAEKP